MGKRNLEFESTIGTDETDQIKIDFGTDHLNDMRFSIKYPDLLRFRSLFSIVDYLTQLKPAEYERLQVAYKDWYANELVRRVTTDNTYFENQSDAKKDVLNELIQRRNKLVQQIGKAMEFYDNNKHKIDEMGRIRANQQKAYPGPMISYNQSSLVFENATEYGDVYSQLVVDVSEQVDIEEEKSGFGWMEYSKPFSDQLQGLVGKSNQEVILTNSKPRSDIRVIRRTDQEPSQIFDLPDQYFQLFIDSAISLSLVKNNSGVSITLSKAELFSIVDILVNQYKGNSLLKVEIHLDPDIEFSIKLQDRQLTIHLHAEEENFIAFTVNSSIFLGLKGLLHLVTSAELVYIGYNLGIILDIGMGRDRLKLISQVPNTSKHRYLRQTYFNYLRTNTTELSLDPEILSGTSVPLPNGSTCHRKINNFSISISNREKKAHILVEEAHEFFTVENSSLRYEQDQIISTIGLESDQPISWQCNCGNVHDYFKCRHLLACLIYGYLEGILYAR